MVSFRGNKPLVMMKRYTAVLVLLAIISSNFMLQAQRVAAPMLRTPSPPGMALHSTVPVGQDRTDPIWTDDFSNAANWTIGVLSGTNDNWVVGTAVPTGDYAIPGINSTTAANGFALFDSDLLCDVDNGYIATAVSIDLSTHDTVELQFEQF